MSQHVLTQSKYTKLLKDLRSLIEEGRAKAEAATQQILVQTYWNVGKRISEEGLLENAGYGDAVLQDLSEDLDIDLSTLKRSIAFFKIQKGATSSTFLTWSHYKMLIPLTNPEARDWYETQAEENQWNTLQLRKAISEERFKASKSSKSKAKKAVLKRPTKPSYIYKAEVVRVIDGDTLLLRIDLGFTVLKEQRIRLAHIDAPALDSKEGEAAYKFVLHKLAEAQSVVVKTNKIDIYGRYVGDIFYSLTELNLDDAFLKGRYLNAELVNEGLAVLL